RWGGSVSGEEVRGPFPDIPAHVVEAVAVRGEASDRGRALEAVQLEVLPRKFALPCVRPSPPVREVLVAPREERAVEAAARGELPLRLGRDCLSGPVRVRRCIVVGDMDDGMAIATVDRA